MPACDTLEETWIVIEGLPPKWISWNIIAQISTMLAVLVNVDWHTIFRSFYEKVRIQVAVRDLVMSQIIPQDLIITIRPKTSTLRKNLIQVEMIYLEKIWILEIATRLQKTYSKTLGSMEPGLCRSALHLLPEIMKKR
ncbi:hypothetical protein VPH35_128291 [Triticum aestivum]